MTGERFAPLNWKKLWNSRSILGVFYGIIFGTFYSEKKKEKTRGHNWIESDQEFDLYTNSTLTSGFIFNNS